MTFPLEDEFAKRALTDPGYAIAWALINLANSIEIAANSLQEPLRSDHPLQGETLRGIEEGLTNIAEAISDAAAGER